MDNRPVIGCYLFERDIRADLIRCRMGDGPASRAIDDGFIRLGGYREDVSIVKAFARQNSNAGSSLSAFRHPPLARLGQIGLNHLMLLRKNILADAKTSRQVPIRAFTENCWVSSSRVDRNGNRM